MEGVAGPATGCGRLRGVPPADPPPVDPPLTGPTGAIRDGLWREVAALRATQRRLRFAPTLYVGQPGAVGVGVPAGLRVGHPMDPPPRRDSVGVRALQDDPGLRFDLLDALVDRLLGDLHPTVDPVVDPAVDPAAGPTVDLAVDPAMLPGYVWLTRPKGPDLHDVDLPWYATARQVFGAHGLVLRGCFAVTRTGWLDLVTGVRELGGRRRA